MKQETRLCSCCNVPMRLSTTVFTLPGRLAVYVVEDVPIWECEQCGDTAMSMENARKVELLTSGRAVPNRQKTAYVYFWGAEPNLVPTNVAVAATYNFTVHEPTGTMVRI